MERVIREAADRIRHMERHLEVLLKAESENPAAVREDDSLKAPLQILTQYYESGQWLHDYELDEKGLLPRDLKRGVLAQDAVYDLLDRIGDAAGQSGHTRQPESGHGKEQMGEAQT